MLCEYGVVPIVHHDLNIPEAYLLVLVKCYFEDLELHKLLTPLKFWW